MGALQQPNPGEAAPRPCGEAADPRETYTSTPQIRADGRGPRFPNKRGPHSRESRAFEIYTTVRTFGQFSVILLWLTRPLPNAPAPTTQWPRPWGHRAEVASPEAGQSGVSPANGRAGRRSGPTQESNQNTRSGVDLTARRGGGEGRRAKEGARRRVPRVPEVPGVPVTGPGRAELAPQTPCRVRRPLTYDGPRRRDDNHGVWVCTHPAALLPLELRLAQCSRLVSKIQPRLWHAALGAEPQSAPPTASAGAGAQTRGRSWAGQGAGLWSWDSQARRPPAVQTFIWTPPVLSFLSWRFCFGAIRLSFLNLMFLESVESGVTRVSRVQPGLSISAARIWCESSQLQARGPFSLCAFALVAF